MELHLSAGRSEFASGKAAWSRQMEHSGTGKLIEKPRGISDLFKCRYARIERKPGLTDLDLDDGWYRGKVNSRGQRHGPMGKTRPNHFFNFFIHDFPGIMYYLNGDRYAGQWRNDRRKGKGTIVMSNGDKYTGSFKNDQRHGEGQMSFGSLDVYK